MSIDRRTAIQSSLGAALAGTIFGSSVEVLAGGGTAQQSGIALQEGVRRIITGNDAQGKSYFVSDDRVAPGSGGFPSLFRTTGDNKVGPGPDGDSLELVPTDMPQIEPAAVGSSFHYQTLPPTTGEPVWHTTETVDPDQRPRALGRGAGSPEVRRRRPVSLLGAGAGQDQSPFGWNVSQRRGLSTVNARTVSSPTPASRSCCENTVTVFA